MQEQKTKKICIIGAGAAGCACAWLLGRHQDKFDVQIWDKNDSAGGVATSFEIDSSDLYINDGVQGGAPSYRNTLLLHKLHGFEPSPVEMKISFGKGDTAWNNYGEEYVTKLVLQLRDEIKRFDRILRFVSYFEYIFVFVSISRLLKLTRFSQEFCNYMVYPLTALFFGTGNQTPNVSCTIIARVFLDPDLKLFDYDPEYLLSQKPEMFAFGNLNKIYETIIKNSGVKICFKRYAVKIDRKRQKKIVITDNLAKSEEFDEVIFACDAESVLKIIDKSSTFMERRVLGNVQYYNDLTVTHEDIDYMKLHYEMDPKRNDQYFIRIHKNEPDKVDMSFNLSNYQPQLSKQKRQIFQTIFLDDKRSDIWNKSEIKTDKILLEKWWRQMAHTWRHFAFTVPFMRFIQGKSHTWFCGSYTLFNTHEIAIISGLAVAVRLGADYPFKDDKLATKQFIQFLKYSHGISYNPLN